ncbi:hypothetical protein [Flavobacterium piscinae]|uniref:hypothetical protein n=1 Tax=Flavobacterium piscinae TaxID=2506424 RepID=UPI002AAA76DF|nr:hypothetical protein [Flavobacterium piscinae]
MECVLFAAYFFDGRFFLPLLTQWKLTKFNLLRKPIIFISGISYALYLLHYSVILQLGQFYFPTNQLSQNQLHLFTICYLVTTVLLATLWFELIEKPIRTFV